VVVATAPLALLAWRAFVNGRMWLGVDGGPVIQDQMQYIGWIRETSEQVLISNHYVAASTQSSYLHPGALISGLVARIGVAPSAGYLLWKPVATLALFGAVWAYVRNLVDAGTGRWLALVLALFLLPPTTLIAGDKFSLVLAGGEVWPVDMLWGYYFSALGVAGIPATLLAYARDRRRGRPSLLTVLLGIGSGWLQPWSSALLIGVIVAAELLLVLARRRTAGVAEEARDPALGQGVRAIVPLVSLSAVAAPLAYYTVLAQVDPSWAVDNRVDDFLNPAWWAIVVTLGPLALPALLIVRRPLVSFQDSAVRVWPGVALAMYVLLSQVYRGHYAVHAIRGLSIPLAVLAVTGLSTVAWGSRRRPALVAAVLVVLVLTVPATVDRLGQARDRINDNRGPYFLTRGERDAFDFLDRSDLPGAVYSPLPMGAMVPAETGRHTTIGNLFWTPDFLRRRLFTDLVFAGRTKPAEAREIVRASGARFLLAGCEGTADLSEVLRPLLASVRRYDCATVYVLRPSAVRDAGGF